MEVSPDAVGRKRPAGTTLPPPGLGDTGAAGHMEPLLAPHPQCPWRRLSLSLSFHHCEMAQAVPDRVSLGGKDRALPAAPAASCPPARGRGARPTGGPAAPSCPGMPLSGGSVMPSGRRAHSRLWPLGQRHPHLLVPSLHQQARFHPAGRPGAQPCSPGSAHVHDRPQASLGARGFLAGRN